MKKPFLFLALALFAGLSAHADNYIIKFRGTITSANGRTRIKETDLVRTNGNVLVYQINVVNKEFDIVESDATGVPDFGQQVHSDDAAVIANGRTVVTDLHDSDGFPANVSGVPVFEGRLMGTARFTFVGDTPASFRMNVSGVWNVDDNSTFKGVITGRRVP